MLGRVHGGRQPHFTQRYFEYGSYKAHGFCATGLKAPTDSARRASVLPK